MKIVFFSDVHGNKYALEKFLEDPDVNGSDFLLFCGDIFGYYYYQDEIINLFRNLKNFRAVLGNHDKIFLDIIDNKIDENSLIDTYGSTYKNSKNKISKDNIDFLRALPEKLELNISGLKFGIFHGTPNNPLNGRLYPDTEVDDTKSYLKFDYVVLGHTHHRLVKKIEGTTILNPGSIGQQRDGKGCSFLILDSDDNSFRFKTVEYDIASLLNDIDRFDKLNYKLKEVLTRKIVV